MSNVMAPFQLLELNVISAQDLAPVTRNMRTYAVAWVHPDRKLSTRVDTQGHTNPTWNDKFVFRVDEEFLYADTSAIMIEIYALHWFKDVHVGTVRVLVGNLIPPPPERPFHNNRAPIGMKFVALQVRRASGRPQGILNIGVTVLDSSMRSMPLYTLNSSAVGYRHLMGEKDAYDNHNHLTPNVFADNNSRRPSNANRSSSAAAPRPELRRTKSDTSSMMGSEAVVVRRSIANKGRANSAISESVVSGSSSLPDAEYEEGEPRKSRRGRRSRGNSVTRDDSPEKAKSVKSKSILSGSLPWRLKKNRNSDSASMMTESEILHIQEPPLPPNFEGRDNVFMHHHHQQHHGHVEEYNNRNSNAIHHDEAMYADNHHHDDDDCASSVNTIRDDDISDDGRHISNNHHLEASLAPSRKQEYLPPPPAQFHSSPAPKFQPSPARQFHPSPAPKFQPSPAPQFRNSPAPMYMSSPKVEPQIKNSPAPYYMSSPKPQYQSSPAPQIWNSPKPQFHSSPAPQFRNSPAPQFHSSPKPQFASSPAQQFRNSPALVPKHYRPSPGPQYRASPGRFNPMSQRQTPMHPFGYTPRFEYTTPRRSNLGNNFGPPLVTESELGPSASEVAAEMARNPRVDEETSTMGGWSLDESVEGLESKLDRWRTELPKVADRGDFASIPATSTSKTPSRRSRKNNESGLFSCFSTICGVECGISCGSDPKGKKKNQRSGSGAPSVDETSFL